MKVHEGMKVTKFQIEEHEYQISDVKLFNFGEEGSGRASVNIEIRIGLPNYGNSPYAVITWNLQEEPKRVTKKWQGYKSYLKIESRFWDEKDRDRFWEIFLKSNPNLKPWMKSDYFYLTKYFEERYTPETKQKLIDKYIIKIKTLANMYKNTFEALEYERVKEREDAEAKKNAEGDKFLKDESSKIEYEVISTGHNSNSKIGNFREHRLYMDDPKNWKVYYSDTITVHAAEEQKLNSMNITVPLCYIYVILFSKGYSKNGDSNDDVIQLDYVLRNKKYFDKYKWYLIDVFGKDAIKEANPDRCGILIERKFRSTITKDNEKEEVSKYIEKIYKLWNSVWTNLQEFVNGELFTNNNGETNG